MSSIDASPFSVALTSIRAAKKCAPELAGLASCLLLAFVLRLYGDNSENTDKHWLEVKAEWPVLLGADTLLALQAMLRFIVLASVAFRSRFGVIMPLGGEAAGLWLGAAFARVLLAWRTDEYKLDGPLGGNLATAFEVFVIPLLAVLGRKALCTTPCVFALLFAGVAWLAVSHQLSLSHDSTSNFLFTAAHLADLLAAVAYLCRTLLIDVWSDQVAMGFGHVILSVQQSLAAYYFLVAFDTWSTEHVTAGLPFQVLAGANLLQFAAYCVSAATFFAELSVEKAVVAAQ